MNGEIPVCMVCLEPISNFICPDCLYKAVQQWFWKFRPELIERFRDFHKDFVGTVVSHKTAICIVCKKEYYHMLCPYDYIREVYSWLYEFLSKKKLREFLNIFSFGLRKINRDVRHWRFYRNGTKLSISKSISDLGVCENCDNFSEHLKLDKSNRMVCEVCR